MGKIIFILFILILLVPVFSGHVLNFLNREGPTIQKALERPLTHVRRELLAPPPLRGSMDDREASLTNEGVFRATNLEREHHGFKAYTHNDVLSRIAKKKMQDLFARQYFEHVSPTGEDVGDLARHEGYQYIIVGENLALGNYQDDAALVQAWMNSPGHRANILHRRFTEIGIAVGRGMYEGQRVWIGVQEFGAPSSLCSGPREDERLKIEQNKQTLAFEEEELTRKKTHLATYPNKRSPEYRAEVEEYNVLVARYNALVEETRILIDTYNQEVENTNRCIRGG